jgi:hypothetical protein
MDRLVWWDEETAAVVVHRTECTFLQEVVRYVVNQYFYKIGKNCILDDSYLHHRDYVLVALHLVLHHLLVMSQCIIRFVVSALAGLIG